MASNSLDDNYGFLNDYLDKVIDQSSKIDPNTSMDDDNDFFNTQSDEPEVNEDIQYDIDNNKSEPDNSEEEQNSGDGNVLDYLLGDSDPYSQEESSEPAGYMDEGASEGGTPTEIPGSVGSKISKNESQGKYSALNTKGGGAGAVGKYQFRWNIWKDSIEKITGVKSREEFQHSPKAQEKYFAWYEKNYLKPAANKLKSFNKIGLNDDQLAQLVHFRGEGGAKKYLLGKAQDKPESYNMSTSKYIGTRQNGGSVPIASTQGMQFNGLNDSSFSEMMFPMHGENEFRGLDSGEPVYLQDEEGNKKILKGKHHTTKMSGKVYEKRLK